jgi:hypothetical protein
VAGVQAEPDAELAHGVPQPGQRVEPAGHRVVPAGGVLDQDRHREAALAGLALDELAPVGEPGRGVLALGDVAAVHDQAERPDRRRGLGVLDDQLARRDADAVVQRGQVDHVRGVHDDRDVAGAQLLGPRVRGGLLPPLRVGQEQLHDVGPPIGGGHDRVVLSHVGADEHAARVVTAPDAPARPLRPRWVGGGRGRRRW